MKSSAGSGGAPWARQNSSKSAWISTVGLAVGGAELLPAGAVGRRQAGEDRRHRRVLDLRRVAGGDPHPGAAAGEEGREADDVVLDDRVGGELVEDLQQPRVDVLGAVDQGLEGRRDEALELVDGRLAEDRGRLADEVLPELPRDFLDLRRRRQPHQPLLEALRLERAGEGLLDDEDDPVPARAQDVADPDAVVGRPERSLGEEDDRRAGGAHRPGLSRRAARAGSGSRP